MSTEIFPNLKGLAWPITKTTTFATRTQEAVSGREVRTTLRANPMYRISLSFEYLSPADAQVLAGFMMRHRGSFESFLFEDKNDNTCTNQTIGVGNGSQTQFQLARAYGGFIEPVCHLKVVAKLSVGGVASSTHAFLGNGIISFPTAPASGAVIAWSGAYYYRARFADDSVEISHVLQGILQVDSLELVATLGNRL